MFRAALLTLCLLLAPGLRAETLTVFAAASLKGPLDEVAADMADVTVAYGGSGTLARQVAQGAPADVVLLANAEWTDWLAARGFVASPRDLFSNALVLVAPRPGEVALDERSLRAALGDGRLAIGMTRSVPAGIYGRAALAGLGLWDAVADRLAEVENVRLALALVARGEVPLGLVYATDAAAEPAVSVVARLPRESHPPIRYSGAAVSGHPRAEAFLDAVAAHPAFAGAGFLPPR